MKPTQKKMNVGPYLMLQRLTQEDQEWNVSTNTTRPLKKTPELAIVTLDLTQSMHRKKKNPSLLYFISTVRVFSWDGLRVNEPSHLYLPSGYNIN